MAETAMGLALQGDLRAETTSDGRAEHGACPRCRGTSGLARPNPAWWLVLVPTWALLLFFGACAAIMLPLNLVLVPTWFACATSVGALARKVTSPRCRDCGEER